jgi:2-dehydro-3-deoxyphosphooctonate aldolase (KDO 8-P synthase)
VGTSVTIGRGKALTIIAGPCVLESLELGMSIGTALKDACQGAGVQYIFKASFDKANRSSIRSPRGPGLEKGLDWLATIASRLGVPCTTDLHEPEQAGPVAQRVDLLQIPAFLCRQTDLLLAAGQAAAAHRRAVNVKKGQFLAPHEMGQALRKLAEAGCTNAMLTERGTTFGYGRLVNDFLGLGDMMEVKGPPDNACVPVCFDATHSTQLPGAGETTGGRPDRAPLLARAAVAAGVDALFIECHPDPRNALSDASTMLDIPTAIATIRHAAAIRTALTMA